MSWIAPTALVLFAGFLCAYSACEWIVKRRSEASRKRRSTHEASGYQWYGVTDWSQREKI